MLRAPKLRTRTDWGANDKLAQRRAALHRTVKQVHVHHTATGNTYKRVDVPGILRGMYRYHTQTLGWFDIGYNFLVDKFGRAWIGRVRRRQQPGAGGAHARLQRAARSASR